jgi:flagellar biosynthesis protein FlhF
MKKTFVSHSIEAACAQARRELGEDAVLIESRAVPVPSGCQRTFAVVACTPEEAVLQDRISNGWRTLAREASRLREELLRLAETLQDAGDGELDGLPPSTAAVAATLRRAEFPSRWIADLLELPEARQPNMPAGAIRSAVIRELVRRMPQPLDWDAGGGCRIAALVGPPGAGKTTTLVKLAARYGTARRRSVLLISTDLCRAGGASQLHAFAGILGADFAAAGSPPELQKTLANGQRHDLVLVDTPGFAPADEPLVREWERMLTGIPQLETHLVLPASGRLTDLRWTMGRFSGFQPAQLILTRLDETSAFGPAVAAALEAERPVSFTTHGQSIPEDLEPATPARLAGLLLPGAQPERAAA